MAGARSDPRDLLWLLQPALRAKYCQRKGRKWLKSLIFKLQDIIWNKKKLAKVQRHASLVTTRSQYITGLLENTRGIKLTKLTSKQTPDRSETESIKCQEAAHCFYQLIDEPPCSGFKKWP